MEVKSICSQNLVTIDARRTLLEAAVLMRDHHVGTLVVTCLTTEGEQVCGIVTDRDLVIHGLANLQPGPETQVGEIAQAALSMIDEDAGIEAALEIMRSKGVRRLLLKSTDHRLSGVLSIDDLIGALAPQVAGLADVIRRGMAREKGVPNARTELGNMPKFPGFGTASWSSHLAA
jgi:predicted transcriptional regulator